MLLRMHCFDDRLHARLSARPKRGVLLRRIVFDKRDQKCTKLIRCVKVLVEADEAMTVHRVALHDPLPFPVIDDVEDGAFVQSEQARDDRHVGRFRCRCKKENAGAHRALEHFVEPCRTYMTIVLPHPPAVAGSINSLGWELRIHGEQKSNELFVYGKFSIEGDVFAAARAISFDNEA